MTIRQLCGAIRAITQTCLAVITASIQETPWAQAIRNVRQAWHHCTSASVARALLQRYPACYLVNGDYASLPRIELTEYRTCQIDHVPLIRVSEKDVAGLIDGRRAYMPPFLTRGATLVEGDGEMPFATGSDIILSVANNGWHLLTVDDARRVLEGRDMAKSVDGSLTPRNRWLSDAERDADAIGIAESLFPFCEQVVTNRVAIIVIYTPGLPKPLRLWRLSLKWIMPPLPPVA